MELYIKPTINDKQLNICSSLLKKQILQFMTRNLLGS